MKVIHVEAICEDRDKRKQDGKEKIDKMFHQKASAETIKIMCGKSIKSKQTINNLEDNV